MPGFGAGEQEGKRTLGRCSRRWKVNFNVYLKKIGWVKRERDWSAPE
jgi:hypothetical protein